MPPKSEIKISKEDIIEALLDARAQEVTNSNLKASVSLIFGDLTKNSRVLHARVLNWKTNH